VSRIHTERLDEKTGTVRWLYYSRDEIDLSPSYQRDGDIWDPSRQRLLIDSILNGFDIPKLYFRSFVPRRVVDDHAYRYAVIDGKQRLEAIWKFLDNQLPLGPESQVEELEGIDPDQRAAMRFEDLSARFPELAERVLNFRLDVVTLETKHDELIEDMFLRLNEASPLNAAEKRNAVGGLLPPATHAFIRRPYFESQLPFPNQRFRHQEMVTKFLYFEHREGAADTKKAYLDKFAADAKSKIPRPAFDALVTSATGVVNEMEKVFQAKDPLLRPVGMSSVYYLVFRRVMEDDNGVGPITRAALESFETARETNRQQAALVDETSAEYDLIEFSRLAQSPNDGVALRFRRDVLLSRLGYEPLGSPLS
jgi:hypothetical protein